MGTHLQSFGGMNESSHDPLDLNDYVMGGGPKHHTMMQDPHGTSIQPFPGMTFDGTSFDPASASTGASAFDPALHAPQMSAHLQRTPTDGVPPPLTTDPKFNSGNMSDVASAGLGGMSSASGLSPDHAQKLGAMDRSPLEGGDGDGGADSKDGIKKTDDEAGDQAPTWSEMKTKAGKDRKRLPLACIACRRKKIRCSGEKPACKHCLRSRIPCVYKVTTRKAAPRTDYMAMLDKRLKRMEDRVIRLIPKDSMGTVASVGRAVVKPSLVAPSTKLANTKKRVAEEAFGSSLDDWANTSGAQGAQGAHGPDGDSAAEENSLLTEGADSLPSKEIQEHLAEVYFDYIYGQTYHLLHKPSYMRRLSSDTLPPVLILAVCATAARFSSHPQVRTDPAFLRGETWASVAADIALRRFDKPSITILIVYVLLGLHEFGTCQGGRSWMFCGMAQRMAYALQLHKDLEKGTFGRPDSKDEELGFVDREIRRRTMWSCFLMDRFTSSGTDRPMFIDERHLKLQLPVTEHYFQLEILGPTEDLLGNVPHPVDDGGGQPPDAKANMGVAAYIIRLVAIWGRIVKYVNLGGKARDSHPMWSPESIFHQLRNQIFEFKTTLPEPLRYNQENLQAHATERTANQFVFLHIIFHQVLLFLHRFALPLGTPLTLDATQISVPSSADSSQRFVADAARTAIEAANKISTLIKDAWEYRVVAPFAGYCAFFSSTVHIQGVFSKNAMVESNAKQNLAYNVRYLTRMKKYWGMFHFVAENLKELYRQQATAALHSQQTGNASSTPAALSSRLSPGASEASMDEDSPMRQPIFQYGDWFDHYPHGVSKTDYEDPAADRTQDAGNDSVMSSKSDLQSVEEFFASLATPSQAEQRQVKQGQRKAQKKTRHSKTSSAPDTKDSQAPSSQPTQASQSRGRPRQGKQDENKSRNRPQPGRRVTDQGNTLQTGVHNIDTNVSPGGFGHSPSSVNMFSSPVDQPHPHSAHPLSPPPPHHPHQQQGDPFASYTADPRQPPSHPHQQTAIFPLSQHPVDESNYWSYDMGLNAPGAAGADPTSHGWFMPFNITPPDLTGAAGGTADASQRSGSMMQGYGSFSGVPMEGLEGLESGPFDVDLLGVDMDGHGGMGHTQGQPQDH